MEIVSKTVLFLPNHKPQFLFFVPYIYSVTDLSIELSAFKYKTDI